MIQPDVFQHDNPWQFACDVYVEPSVAKTCLQLQHEYGVNVPLLLFCCWLGGRYGDVSTEILQQALDFSDSFSQQVTQPLRLVRQEMKSSYQLSWPMGELEWQELREDVKALELSSEKLLLDGLGRLVKDLIPQFGGEAASLCCVEGALFQRGNVSKTAQPSVKKTGGCDL